MKVDPGNCDLEALCRTIVDHTHGDGFWIGEILLSEIHKETGYKLGNSIVRPDARHMMARIERNAVIEECARAAEAQDRVGYEWVRDSLWDTICRRAGANVRRLAGK